MYRFTSAEGQITLVPNLNNINCIVKEDTPYRTTEGSNEFHYYMTTSDDSMSIRFKESELSMIDLSKLYKINDNMYINKEKGRDFLSSQYYRNYGTFYFGRGGGHSARMTLVEFEAASKELTEVSNLTKKFEGVKIAARRIEG